MRFIREHRNQFTVKRMCSALEVSEKGYYNWLKRPPSNRKKENQIILDRISVIYQASGKRYGSPKILHELKKQGFRYGHKRIERIMKNNNIRSIIMKKRKPFSGSVKIGDESENLLNRNFIVPEAKKVWVTDITYIKAVTGWLYLCVYIDLFSRKIVGWSVSRNPDAELVLTALTMACENEQPGPGLLVHSDQGTQYGSHIYRNTLRDRKFTQSMSRRGNCWDNACVESFFHLLKGEELNWVRIEDIRHLHGVAYRYIEIFYNRIRSHSSLGYMSPVQFENNKKCLTGTV